jgi:processive 1,2-diacylglycerol beta-glucosyltransferase
MIRTAAGFQQLSGVSDMVRRRIAILTLSVGSGHVRAAEVVSHALLVGGEDVEIQILDAVSLARPWFVAAYVQTYWWMLRYAPGMWRRLFEHRQKRRHRSTAPEWFFRWGCAPVLQRLKSFAPHLVIVTEIGAAEIGALAKRDGCFAAPILAVQTDFQTEPPWVQPEIDVYCVASNEAKTQLITWGVSTNRILLSGIPVDPAFALPFDREELLQALGLDPRRPVVLVMGGGMGPIPMVEIVQSLELTGLPLQVVAIAGHDLKLRAQLGELRGKLALDLHAFGWSERIPEFMASAGLLVTKPGGVTAAEALAAGLPMILTHPIPGPEERHSKYLEGLGVAIRADRAAEIPQLVHRLLSNPDELNEMARRARDLARPDAAHAIAQVARAMLEKGSYIDLLATPRPRSGESAYLM